MVWQDLRGLCYEATRPRAPRRIVAEGRRGSKLRGMDDRRWQEVARLPSYQNSGEFCYRGGREWQLDGLARFTPTTGRGFIRRYCASRRASRQWGDRRAV